MDRHNTFEEDRTLLLGILQQEINVVAEGPEKGGDAIFLIDLADLGLTEDDIFSSHLVNTKFFANTVGEWVLRSNLDKFTDLVTKMNPTEYRKMVAGTTHQNFGMFIGNGQIKFEFHISLVHQIVNEDLKDLNI